MSKDNAMKDNKYDLFDLVYYKDATWWVTGLWAEVGYDVATWSYQLTKPCYSEAKAGDHGWLGGRMDVDTAPRVKEHEILSGGDVIKTKLDDLAKQKDALLESLRQLERQEALVKTGLAS